MGDTTKELWQRLETVLEGDDTRLADALASLRPADIAEVFELFDDHQRSRVIFALPPRSAAEVISLIDEAERGEVVEDLDDAKLTELVAELPPDDAADVLAELPEERSDEVLEHVPDDKAAQIEELLEYDEESAGGIMTPELIALTGQTTVGQSVEHVRAASPQDDLNEIYVIDLERHLLGVVPLRMLLTAPRDTPLADICSSDPVSVRSDQDQEEVVHIFAKYDLPTLPVVDEWNRLKGRITADDIMDVAQEEAAEDMYRMAGMDPAEMETASLVRAAFSRLVWLLPCMLIITGTATAIALAQENFEVGMFTAVMAFVPMVGAMSGNSGIQISTVIIRGLATGEWTNTRIGLAFHREGIIALIMAPICGLTAASISWVGLPLLQALGSDFGQADRGLIAQTVGFGMTAAILIAGGLGIVLPFLFRRIGVDPAIASGPIVTTMNDVISVSIYLLISIAILA